MLTILSHFAPSAKGLQNTIDVCYAYSCDNDIAQNHVMFFDTVKYCHMKNIMLGQKKIKCDQVLYLVSSS